MEAPIRNYEMLNLAEFMSCPNRDTEFVWNFAFGANMNPKSLEKMRKIKPVDSKCGYVPSWKFSFDYDGIPFVEPGFGTMAFSEKAKCRDSAIHGVFHKMTKSDFIHLMRTEGGGGHQDLAGYDPVKIHGYTYEGEKMDALALVANFRINTCGRKLKPSQRYHKLVCDGARHHKLDDHYIAHLESMPYHVPSYMDRILMAMFLALFFPLIFFHLTVIKCERPGATRSHIRNRISHTSYRVWMFVQRAMWTFHNMLPLTWQSAYAADPKKLK